MPVPSLRRRRPLALADALRKASGEEPHKSRWLSVSSSTVVMRDVFTLAKFYSRAPDYLFLFQHCALKRVPEAVVEGMGSVWDRCASPGRHLSFEAGAQEAVVCWNAPKSWTPECTYLIDRALHIHFKGKGPHFTHSTGAITKRAEQSKVIQKQMSRHAQTKLPWSRLYGGEQQ